MNPYYNSIIDDINNNKPIINLSDSNLTDENVIEIADLIKDNNSIKVLKIGNIPYCSEHIDRFTYYLNIRKHELIKQYNTNIRNKITIEGYSYLFETLKYNNSIHTLKLDEILFEDSEVFYDENHRKNFKNNDILINILSEMLLINKSITKLTVNYNTYISDETFIKFCNAIKNHNDFYKLNVMFKNFDNEDMYNIFLESLTNQMRCSLTLTMRLFIRTF